jgi:hypothetical protein
MFNRSSDCFLLTRAKGIGLAIISQFRNPPDVPIVTCTTIEESDESFG